MDKKKSKLNFKNKITNFSEIKKRIFFLIFSLIIFRLGSFIPIPGVDTGSLSKILKDQHGSMIEMFNVFSGGSLNRASIFSLGIMPYISSSIIIQLLTFIYPSWKELQKEGESGRIKINQYTKFLTVFISFLQAIGISLSVPNLPGMKSLIFHIDFYFYIIAVVSLVTGTIFLIWIGDLITEYGLGNGISVIIFSGIISNLPSAIINTLEELRIKNLSLINFLIIIILIFSIIYLVVFIERSQRKIIINYSNRRHNGYFNSFKNSSYLPLKINMSGVIPAIFASSVVLFPITLISWFKENILDKNSWCNFIFLNLQPGQPIYIFIYTFLIIFFCFFYTNLAFNSRETSDNLKKSGAFIQGVRPGENTSNYIKKIMFKLTFINTIYIVFICLLPEFMRKMINVPFYFGGTSLLIVVVVIIDLISQLQTLLLSKQYKLSFKRANLNLKK
ncbi:MAG: preprotein translocase subunit SecY [Buchnera aphidicola (Periphyllus lyropictus)]|uniref:preprotein translocase subunit SecY n=1 Tax=Buchnera aphidicola TaxID=9 RepID=UPI001EC63D46|nr:preprotein translocase subunit SecY [Buchnera aphidicola]NIH16493.1 preprotein translocase subunit SecY [Buchnera aphidicola (Periphyllus lyropictus)]USS94778.1 preprotein translocase subunit SecY [Buchnera aphidicola (Periphyllus lyropictus)]